jgi:hypothetical protein
LRNHSSRAASVTPNQKSSTSAARGSIGMVSR